MAHIANEIISQKIPEDDYISEFKYSVNVKTEPSCNRTESF